MMTSDLSKNSLRALCRTRGIKNYGKLTNSQMRAALEQVSKQQVVSAAQPAKRAVQVVADTTDAPPAKPAKAKPAAKAKGPGKRGRKGGELSVRDWIAQRAVKGSVKIADALAYAASTGRSKVTVYRMAGESGLRAKNGEFVRNK